MGRSGGGGAGSWAPNCSLLPWVGGRWGQGRKAGPALDRWKIPSPWESALWGVVGGLSPFACSAQGRVRAIIFCH